MKEKKKFVFIDALSLAYKAYFAFISHPLINSKGVPTSAIYGFVNQLFKIIEDTKPDYIAVAFDSHEKTFRHERYEAYKSSRQEMPDDMIPQIEKIKEVINAFNIPIYILPGYEADDLIGTAVKKAEAKGLEAIAVTPDKDYVQLITDNIKIVKPGKSTNEIQILDKERVLKEYGFEPERMIDYLALVGDASDDIPGVKGIGPKTALPLIQQFGTIENIYANLDKIEKASVVKKLEAGRENAFLSKELATIKLDVPFEMNFEEAKFTPPDFERVNKLFAELEFKNFGEKLLKLFPAHGKDFNVSTENHEEKFFEFKKSETHYHLITNVDEARKLAEELKHQELFVFDTETDNLNYLKAKLAGVSFALREGEAYFVAINPFEIRTSLFDNALNDRLPLEEFVKIFKSVFEDEKIKKVCQNGKYDIGVLRTNGIEVNNFYFDTMLASYVLDPDQKHGMDELARTYLHYSPIPITEIIGNKKNAKAIFDVELEKLKDYAAEDSDITFRLYKILKKRLQEEKLEKVAYEIEFPLAPVLEQMERNGIRLDVESLKAFSKELETMLENFSRQIYNMAGTTFNINSTKQLQEILFNKLGLKPTKKTKTGYSTDARSLESLRGQHDIIEVLLNYRQVSKLKSTYADALPKLIDPETQRVHTTYNQTVASTGRLSSLDPNLQNIPIRTELGREIRKAFIPTDENYVILSADYSQIELRIMASICEDEYLIEAFKRGEDIHRHTAALVFEVSPEEVTPEMRRKAKEVNFGILYGIGAFGLKTRLGISQTHAQEIIDTYFKTFKNVKAFIDEAIRKAREKGYAETLLGRRRYLRNINSKNRTVRQFEERVAINMPIQGTAADMIKLAMIKIHEELKKRRTKTKMVLQVHDELVFDAHKDELEELKPLIKQIMEEALPLNVPVIADLGIGKNWLEAH